MNDADRALDRLTANMRKALLAWATPREMLSLREYCPRGTNPTRHLVKRGLIALAKTDYERSFGVVLGMVLTPLGRAVWKVLREGEDDAG